MFLCVSERPAFSDRAAFCQSVANEYFGKAVLASLNEDYLNNDTRAAVSITCPVGETSQYVGVASRWLISHRPMVIRSALLDMTIKQ